MHLGRLLPNYIIPISLCALMMACASDRYVGSVGKTGNYANRGYGLVVALQHQKLLDRWEFIDPRNLDIYQESVRPVLKNEIIDMNGDGTLHHDELVLQWAPNLRLVNKQRPGNTIDIAVDILGGKNKSSDPSAYPRYFVKQEFTRDTRPEQWKSLTAGPDYPAQWIQLDTTGSFLAAIDQGLFLAEEKAVRRQIVWVKLSGPQIPQPDKNDFFAILQAISLNGAAGQQTSQEQY